MGKCSVKGCFLTAACIWGICVGLLLMIGTGVIVFEAVRPESYYLYEVTDTAQYGVYTGTGNDTFVSEYIGSFFPESLKDTFSDVTYSYIAKSRDTYAFEAYLEFTITDPDEFARHLAQIADAQWQTFPFDGNFMEYTLDDQLDLFISAASTETEVIYAIEQAKIGKILCNPQEQRIIYVAIGVYDGGGVDTKELNVFFDRFNIDPTKMMQP